MLCIRFDTIIINHRLNRDPISPLSCEHRFYQSIDALYDIQNTISCSSLSSTGILLFSSSTSHTYFFLDLFHTNCSTHLEFADCLLFELSHELVRDDSFCNRSASR